jgi:hypothetical protein
MQLQYINHLKPSNRFFQFYTSNKVEKKITQRLSNNYNKGCVTFCGLAIYIKKYLKAKEEELWKLNYFHHAKI